MVASKIGYLFPGQGAQYVGMGKDWVEKFEKAARIYRQADQILGISLSRYCFEGPEETLTRTQYAQPAIFVTSLACLAVIEEECPELKPDLVAGLSLGEFTALVSAGSLSFKEGLQLVQRRAELMESAAQQYPGTMISILGLNQEACLEIAKASGLELANLNAPDQFVLSGPESSVDQAVHLAEERGAKRAIRLRVGGAFHSRLMQTAKQGLREALRSVSLKNPQVQFVPNVTAQAEMNPERIRTLLEEQVTSSVRWFQTMDYAKEQGVRRFIEIGPGRVLKGLAKQIDSSLEVFPLERVTDLESLEQALQRV